MKLPDGPQRPSKPWPATLKWTLATLTFCLFLIPTQVYAQCAGDLGISNDGVDSGGAVGIPDYLSPNLPETVTWTLTPSAGDVLAVDVDEVKFALGCADNGDAVDPCDNGNDAPDSFGGPTPFTYTGGANPGGTCGATASDDGAGTVTFSLPDVDLDEAGCTIIFTTSLNDKGTDGDPLIVTTAATHEGTCSDGSLDGGAQGSAAVEIIEPICIPEIEVCVAVDTDNDGDFIDEECIPGNIGLTGNGDRDPKDYRYFVNGGIGAGSDDLGSCIIEEETSPDNWVEVANLGSVDGALPSGPFEIGDGDYEQAGVCSADNARNFRLNCGTCDGFELDIPQPEDSADVVCVDCDVTIEKTSTCDDGASYGESCIGWVGDDETQYQYVIENTGDVDLDSCTLSDNLAWVSPQDVGPYTPGQEATVFSGFDECEDIDGNTLATVDCACQATAFGSDLSIGDNRVGVNTADVDASFGPCSAEDSDDAEIMCQSVDLSISKVCEEQDVDLDNAVTITIMNAGTAPMEDCTLTDALVTSDITCDQGIGVVSGPFDIPAETTVSCTGEVNGLEVNTLNEASISCTIAGTTKPVNPDPATDMCEVPGDCITRTPGFWKNHPRVIEELGLEPVVCGLALTSTEANDDSDPFPAGEGSTVEDMCVSGKEAKDTDTTMAQLQLYRQCTAAALNLAASVEGGGSCERSENERFDECCGFVDETSLCGNAPTAEEINASGCIEDLDEFNNSEDSLDPFGPFESPGPASSQECREAGKNAWINDRDHGPRNGGGPAANSSSRTD